MKKNEENILRYLSDLMSREEREQFQRELSDSTELSGQLEKYKVRLKNLNTDNIEIDSRYFINLLPKVREKLEQKSRSFLLRKIYYLVPSAVVVIIAFAVFYNPANNSLKLNEAVADVVNRMNDTEVVQKYISDIDSNPNEYITFEKSYDFDIQVPEDEINLDALQKIYDKYTQGEFETLNSLPDNELELIASNLNTIKIK